MRGGRFVAAATLAQRVDATLAAVRSAPRALVHLYWGDLDKVGHVTAATPGSGATSSRAIDRELARLAARLPDDCSLTVTADHGMVDSPTSCGSTSPHEPLLAAGVRHVTGEARAPAALRRAGRPRRRARRVDRACSATAAIVLTRDDAVAAGWFGAGAAGEPAADR